MAVFPLEPPWPQDPLRAYPQALVGSLRMSQAANLSAEAPPVHWGWAHPRDPVHLPLGEHLGVNSLLNPRVSRKNGVACTS